MIFNTFEVKKYLSASIVNEFRLSGLVPIVSDRWPSQSFRHFPNSSNCRFVPLLLSDMSSRIIIIYVLHDIPLTVDSHPLSIIARVEEDNSFAE